MTKEHLRPTSPEKSAEEYLNELTKRINNLASSEGTVIRSGTDFSREFSELLTLGPVGPKGYDDDPIVKAALNDPEILKGLIAKKSYYTVLKELNDAGDRLTQKLYRIPTGLTSTQKKALEKKLLTEATQVKRLLSLLGNDKIRNHMLKMEKRANSLDDDYLINEKAKHPAAIDFLVRLNNGNLSILEYARLYPFILQVLHYKNFFSFDIESLKQFKITKTGNADHNVSSPYSEFLVTGITTNLRTGTTPSMEEDLVLLSISDPGLFEYVWSKLTEAIMSNSTATSDIKLKSGQISQYKSELGRVAKKITAYKNGASADVDRSSPARPNELSAEAQERKLTLQKALHGLNIQSEIQRLKKKKERDTITDDEKETLAQLWELEDLLDDEKAMKDSSTANAAYQNANAELAGLIREYDRLKDSKDPNDIKNSKKLEAKIAKARALFQDRETRIAALNAEELALREGGDTSAETIARIRAIRDEVTELESSDPYYERQLKLSLNENQKKMLQLLGDSVRDSLLKTAGILDGKEREEEVSTATWAGVFVRSCYSIDTYIMNFYKPLYEQMLQKVKSEHSHTDSHGHHSPEHEEHLKHEAVEMTEDKIHYIISSVITNALSPVIESGGEPLADYHHQEQHGAFMGQPPSSRLLILLRALTRLKIESASLKKLPSGCEGVPFANAFRDQLKIWNPIERQNEELNFGRVQHEIDTTPEMFFKHARDLEELFETIFVDVKGNNDIRAQIMKGADFYKEIHGGQLNGYSRSKQFDVINNIKMLGPEVAATLPSCKIILENYFAEHGWLTFEEVERDLSSPKGYLNSLVGDFMKEYYPHYSANKRNLITYIAVKQAYLHSMYQLTLSNTRFRAGFSGGKHLAGNMYFNDQVMSDKYPGSLSHFSFKELMDHKNFAKGALFVPSSDTRLRPGELGFEAVRDIDPTNIQTFHDVLYGATMYELSGKYGLMLRHFNKRFQYNLPQVLQPQNRFKNGSDENLRGWRQLKKSKDNVSHALHAYAERKDWVTINSKYSKEDHYTVIWKSVENLGTNYLRTWSDLMLGTYNEEKLDHLCSYIYDRYFDPKYEIAGIERFGADMLASAVPDFAGVSTKAEFLNAIRRRIDTMVADRKRDSGLVVGQKDYKEKYDKIVSLVRNAVYNEIFYAAFMVLAAERTPTIFSDTTNPWNEQTGVTLLADIKTSIISGKAGDENRKLFGVAELDSHGKSTDPNELKFIKLWSQAKNDLIYIQQSARKESIDQIIHKRKDWEKASTEQGFDSNTFGDFQKIHSDIQLSGSGVDGYRITDSYIRKKLSEHYKDLDPREQKDRIERVISIRRLTLTKILEAPDLPDYDAIKADVERLLAKGDPKVVSSDFKGQITANIGLNAQDYKNKHGGNLQQRSKVFMETWSRSNFVFEPEADAAENFMRYENADANHIGRMAGITEVTSVKSKADLSYEAETSINEAVKNWSKDPIKAIDTMAEYLNKYYHTIEDERGAEYALDYKGWYINRCMQTAMKEEKYRRGISGAWRDVLALLFKQNKTSFGGSKNQPFTSQSLSALKTREAIRYMIQKKLIGPDQGDEYMRRYRATLVDVFLEALPRVAAVGFLGLAVNLFVTSSQKDANLKSSK